MDATCAACGADWASGAHTPDCRCCGGGALERACPSCEGRCDARWRRAVVDSNDARLAHWVGGCALPAEERHARLMELLGAERARRET